VGAGAKKILVNKWVFPAIFTNAVRDQFAFHTYFYAYCFYAFVLCVLCFIGNIVTIISYHGRPTRWITLFWQPTYPLHLYT